MKKVKINRYQNFKSALCDSCSSKICPSVKACKECPMYTGKRSFHTDDGERIKYNICICLEEPTFFEKLFKKCKYYKEKKDD